MLLFNYVYCMLLTLLATYYFCIKKLEKHQNFFLNVKENNEFFLQLQQGTCWLNDSSNIYEFYHSHP